MDNIVIMNNETNFKSLRRSEIVYLIVTVKPISLLFFEGYNKLVMTKFDYTFKSELSSATIESSAS